MSKHIHVYVGGKAKTKDAEPQPDAKTVASILRRCSIDAKRLSNDFETLARLVESGEEKISMLGAKSAKEKLLSVNLPAN